MEKKIDPEQFMKQKPLPAEPKQDVQPEEGKDIVTKTLIEYADLIVKQGKEIERLKALIEEAYWAGQGQATETLMIGAGNDTYRNDKAKSLSQFKTANNL